ncbi:MAG: outer membrane protein transport protein, partial [Deltaproteobacteria bacterium]|nr:outer membrane protein transport protein [Deltaproteobacteria bacterium]
MINKRVVFILFFCLLFCAGSVTVWGSGFHIHEQGAKAMGMGNAFVGLADDPSTLFYNPAGIAFQKGTQIDLGATAISVPNTKFRGSTKLGNSQVSPGFPVEGEARAKRDVFLPPNLYVVHSFENAPISVGLGINSIYSLSKRWKSGSIFQDEVRDISIKSLNFQPTVAYRLDKYNLAFAVGIDYTYAMLRLEKSVYADIYHLGDLEYDGDADGWGYNFGVLWKPLDCLSLGLAYRSKVVLKADGNADFTQVVGPYAGFHGHGDVTINLPDTWSFGIAYHPAKAWTL